jgi:plasmid stabilization system protein ParE
MRVRYTPRAQRDLEAILRYLDEHSPQGMRKRETRNRKYHSFDRAVSAGRASPRAIWNARIARWAISVSDLLEH